jgi:hypothetical protein
VACPAEGALAEALDAHAIERLPLPGTTLSFRIHPVTTSRGLIDLVRSAVVLRRTARTWGADVIHAFRRTRR